MAALWRREEWQVNARRVYRLYRQEGLNVRQEERRTRSPGRSANACHLRRAEHKEHVWCRDFTFIPNRRGTRLKWLPIIVEYLRECSSLTFVHSIRGEDVLDTLAEPFARRRVLEAIRSGNCPEFVTHCFSGGSHSPSDKAFDLSALTWPTPPKSTSQSLMVNRGTPFSPEIRGASADYDQHNRPYL